MDTNYNEQLSSALIGRTSRTPQFSAMGEALGFPEGDVHATRFYRIFLTLDKQNAIQEVLVKVDGELISPCSGYFPEVLDEFDFYPVLQWCLREIGASPDHSSFTGHINDAS